VACQICYADECYLEREMIKTVLALIALALVTGFATLLANALPAVAAGPNEVICGEKAQISVTIRDSAGQPVSDHTLVEFVTNYGGVLAGTGTAAAGGLLGGDTAPLSSTTAETFDGVATVYLLTSSAHVGPYEVLISTGGSALGNWPNGSLLLPYGTAMRGYAPVTSQVTVTCRLATP
jgi:hypothetical protein